MRIEDRGSRIEDRGRRAFLFKSVSDRSAILDPRSSILVLLLALAGCAVGKPHVDEALDARTGGSTRSESAVAQYRVACPDVLELRVEHHPELSGLRPVGADGRMDLGSLGWLRVEGQTPQEVADTVARVVGMPAAWVRVRVAEFNSQQVYLFGEVSGLQRAVAYQGPETVADLLQRVGGITPGAAPSNVHVVRPRLIDSKQPEVFQVDLQAIVLNQDQKTNVRLQPFDQVYVGQTRPACWEKCVPPWLRPLYEACWGLNRSPAGKQPPPKPAQAGHQPQAPRPLVTPPHGPALGPPPGL